jgi:hypothetical protein
MCNVTRCMQLESPELLAHLLVLSEIKYGCL